MIRHLPFPSSLFLRRGGAVALLWLGLTVSAGADELSDVRRLQETGQSAEALALADRAIATQPKNAPMRFLKGVLLADAKRNDDAIAVFRSLNEDYPDLPEPYNNLAALYAAAGEYDKARVTLELALRTNPGYVTALENLGDVYAMLANRSYAQALKLDAHQAPVLLPKIALLRELFTPRTDAAASPPPPAAPLSPGAPR